MRWIASAMRRARSGLTSPPAVAARTTSTGKPRCSSAKRTRSAANASAACATSAVPGAGSTPCAAARARSVPSEISRSIPVSSADPSESARRPASAGAGRTDRAIPSRARRRSTATRTCRACRRAKPPPTQPRRRPAARATAARPLRRRSAGTGSRWPSRPAPAALPRRA